MAIDASIYSNIQTPQANMPNPLDVAQKAMTLGQLGMQQQQMQYQMAQRRAMMQAYADNTDADGNVNQQGAVSDLAKMGYGPQAMELQQQVAAQNKAQAEAQTAQMQAMRNKMDVGLPIFDHLLTKVPPEQRATVYPNYMQMLKNEGIDFGNVLPSQYDEGLVQRFYAQSTQQKEALDKALIGANIGEAKAKTAEALANAGAPAPLKLAAEELAQFKDDVANPSNRKITGSLTDAINRADRIATLSNAGAPPNETPQQRVARLNAIIPQIAKEYNVSLASIMQGGVPSDALLKELGTDTFDSGKASAIQKITNDPTGAQQAKFIEQMVGTAQHLRGFASQRLQDIGSRSRAAYPYANKYFSKEMDQIQSPILAPALSGQSSGAVLGGNENQGGGVPGVSSATASDKLPASSVKPGDVRRGYLFNGGNPRDPKNWKKASR
jgi:hypothetical protein